MVEPARAVQALQEAYLHAVAAVDPTKLVKAHVRTGALDDWLVDREHPATLHVLALGKAAARMTWGLVEANVPFRGVGVHPGGVPVPQWDGFQWLRGEHPVPGDGSFAAGEAVWHWIETLPAGAPVLVLLSGGASSLLERPRDDTTRESLVDAWRTDLRAGLPIEQLNERRAARSSLKAGGLARHAGTRPVRVWLLSDTPPERPDAVGGGPLWTDHVQHTVLAGNDHAVQAAGAALQAAGYAVYKDAARIHGEAEAEADRFVTAFLDLEGDRVALVGGGEPTVALPPDAPPGGRCQHAALAAAGILHERGSDATFLAGATDGRDGVDVAAAWSDAALWATDPDGAQAALDDFDAHRHLAARDHVVRTGATGTNVGDVWILVR